MATVLVINADAARLATICQALRNGGYQVLASRHADHALRLCFDHLVDIVVLDDVLDDVVGTEVAVRLKKLRRGLPVLLITGDAAIGNDLAFVDAVIPNHAGSDELLAKLHQLLDGRAAGASGE